MAKATPGIRVRHGRECRSHKGGGCSCSPVYEAWVYDARATWVRKCDGKQMRGQKIRRTFPTLAAAKLWRADATSGLAKGTMKAPTKQTLEQAAETWLEGAKAHAILTRSGAPYKPAVLRGYEADLRRYVLPELGAHRLADLRRADLQWFVDKLIRDGKTPTKIHATVMPIRAICRYAIERDEILVNPTANLRLPATGDSRDRVASPAEAARLLDALPEEDRALWAVAFYAGLRRGELRGLRDEDVDLDANLIHVRRGWDEVEGPIEPKSKKGERQVPVPAILRRYLLEHRARTGRRGDDLFFGRTARDAFTPTHLRRQALKAWAAASVGAFFRGESIGLEPIRLHECRHTYVSLMHAAGRSLEEIGDYVGHTSAYMTDKYRHLIDGQRQQAAAAFDAFLGATGAQTGAQGR